MFAIAQKLMSSYVLPGWTSVAVIISFLCGMNMLMTGIIGIYVGRIHREVQRRPLYVVSRQELLLQIVIYLRDLEHVPELNRQWDGWVIHGHAPVRACVQAGLGEYDPESGEF